MRTSLQQKLILSVMVTSLALVLLFAGGMIGYKGYALIVLSSVFAYVLTCEHLYGTTAFAYVLTSALAWLIIPDKNCSAAYILLLGHFPIFKSFIDSSGINKIIGLCLKLIYCNIFVILALCIVLFGLKKSVPDISMPKWAVVSLLQLVFIAMDLIHSFCRWFYVDKIRSGIMHN